jgi:hypothetical protein
MTTKEQEESKREEEIKEYISALDHTHKYNIELFDKQALLIGTGAIVVSLSFLSFLKDNPLVCLGSFYFAEVLFVISLLVSLFSSLYSSGIALHNLKIAHAYKRKEKITGQVREYKYTKYFNWTTALLLLLGIVSICYFAINNIEHLNP